MFYKLSEQNDEFSFRTLSEVQDCTITPAQSTLISTATVHYQLHDLMHQKRNSMTSNVTHRVSCNDTDIFFISIPLGYSFKYTSINMLVVESNSHQWK